MKNRTVILSLVLLLLLSSAAAVHAQATPAFSINAQAGVLLDVASGQILFSQNGSTTWMPASLVKIMTMYIALDQIGEGRSALDDIYIVSEQAWRMGGSQMFLEIGEQVTIEQLLYGIAVVSGNDATVAVAESMAGTESLFVRWMNEKAAGLGLDLHFADVHGLSDQNRINALDMAWLAYHYISDHPEGLHYHQTLSFGYQPRSRTTPIVQNNRNGLLTRYEGADGLKTGYLSAAGYNLIATAVRDGRRLIAVVLGAENAAARENEAVNMLNYGFRSFEAVDVQSYLPSGAIRVYKGAGSVTVIPAVNQIVIPRGTGASLETEMRLDRLEAPLTAGQTVGELVIRHDGQLLQQVPLVTEYAVERGNILRVAYDSISLLFQQIIDSF